jgi:hypothetical protein
LRDNNNFLLQFITTRICKYFFLIPLSIFCSCAHFFLIFFKSIKRENIRAKLNVNTVHIGIALVRATLDFYSFCNCQLVQYSSDNNRRASLETVKLQAWKQTYHKLEKYWYYDFTSGTAQSISY